MNPRPEQAHDAFRLADDWRRFAEKHWAREPVVLSGGPPCGLDAAQAHALLVAAAATAASGGTDAGRVRLAVPDGDLRSPGPLLPSPADPDTRGYAARISASDQLAGSGWLLTVADPLSLDFGLWSRVRQRLAGLWRHVGWPALPVTAELAVGVRHQAAEESGARPDAAVLTWVIEGALTVRVRPEHTGTEFELHAEAGDLVHWPAGSTHLDDRSARCTTLRLAVPARTTSALPYVGDVLEDLLRDRPAPGDGPTTAPHPAPAGPDGRLTPARHHADQARRYATVLAGDEPERALLLRWAGLRSAAGLDPVPPPRPRIALTPRHRLRRTTSVLHVTDRDGTLIWAAHGHARRSVHPAADRILARLRTTPLTTVAALAAACGLPPDDHELLALLGELYAVRAVETTEAPSEPRP
ncbi:hypothetical protein [Streptomyces sp. NPDC052225]|uniref:hypothetical protein n=1 Tax=Streptomyces sp. NPDC052225 TaxID=3154949 RepID=UPI003423FC19